MKQLKDCSNILKVYKLDYTVVVVLKKDLDNYDEIFEALAQQGIDETFDIRILTKYILAQDLDNLQSSQVVVNSGELVYEKEN